MNRVPFFLFILSSLNRDRICWSRGFRVPGYYWGLVTTHSKFTTHSFASHHVLSFASPIVLSTRPMTSRRHVACRAPRPAPGVSSRWACCLASHIRCRAHVQDLRLMPLRREVVGHFSSRGGHGLQTARAARPYARRRRAAGHAGYSALIRCWRTTCSQLARFGDCRQRGMQPGQPGRCADCSSLPTQRTDCSCDELLVH